MTSAFPISTTPIQLQKVQDSNIIDLSVESTTTKSTEKSSLVNIHQSRSQELTAINKKLMKMDTVMKPTFSNSIVTSMQHNIFNFQPMGTELPPAFQNIHVPMFGFSVPPPILPTLPVIVQSPMNSNPNYQLQPMILNEPIEVSSDESTKGGEDMEIEPPTVQETPPKESLQNKSPQRSPSLLDKKKKIHKKHKKNKKGNEEKLEKNRKRKRKNKELYEEQPELQKDKKKKEKKKDKKDKKVLAKSEEDPPFTVAASTNDEFKSDLLASPMQITPIEPIEIDTPIPKLTLKIGSLFGSTENDNSNEPPTEDLRIVETARVEGNSSPELAKISALITHAPKVKSIENLNKSPQLTCLTPNIANSTSFVESFKSPLNISTSSAISTGETDSLFISPKIEKNITTPTASANIQRIPTSCSTSTAAPPPIESNRPSSYIDEEGNEVWICPACGRVDDGTPMIGCDGCDAWYHWICVGIKEPPNKSDDWFCRVCILKNREEHFNFPYGERKKKSKKSKKSSKNVD